MKCIYIDPPYNTGNRDFIYNDRFINKEDGWRHSKWIEFMHKRLLLAKELLREDGVIFVSIDDNELFHLGMLMNQVFGEGNFVANCLWQKKYAPAADHKSIAPMHDYILVYQASPSWQRNLLPRGEEKDRQYKFEDKNGTFRISDYTCNKSADERPNLFYPVKQPNTNTEVWPKRTRVWAYSRDEHLRHVEEGLIYWGKDGQGSVPGYKRYKHALKNADGVVPHTWWTFSEVGHNDTAKKELMAILHEEARAFSTPKPSTLIERILQIGCGPDDIILDFFAGSGTTAHAVMKLNAEDGGNRQFILVSSTEATDEEPNKNLCRDVCAKRVQRVCEGYGEVPGLGGGFAYLRIVRIEPGRLLRRLQHEQVWITLQLMHLEALVPEPPGGILWVAGEGRSRIIYLTQTNEKTWGPLERALADSPRATIYTWAPEIVRHHAPKTSVRPIPKFLLERLGLTP